MLKSKTVNQKSLGVFFSIVTFHLENVSANMTFKNQYMNIHVTDTYIEGNAML